MHNCFKGICLFNIGCYGNEKETLFTIHYLLHTMYYLDCHLYYLKQLPRGKSTSSKTCVLEIRATPDKLNLLDKY